MMLRLNMKIWAAWVSWMRLPAALTRIDDVGEDFLKCGRVRGSGRVPCSLVRPPDLRRPEKWCFDCVIPHTHQGKKITAPLLRVSPNAALQAEG